VLRASPSRQHQTVTLVLHACSFCPAPTGALCRIEVFSGHMFPAAKIFRLGGSSVRLHPADSGVNGSPVRNIHPYPVLSQQVLVEFLQGKHYIAKER
jgi:hypothetical protein